MPGANTVHLGDKVALVNPEMSVLIQKRHLYHWTFKLRNGCRQKTHF